ncbi:helix-turn-helix transcriptional regulator [Paenibacillus albicereus]|uniref:Helix-turn-helix transcriptional regulator n=2 Tax=Paenibacillus albicereus TaxID=2726185 RepID=A0A6H2H3Z5_9BACL|nr:helix-turn-helix transcriptional regulator [Paenibacillus albicereus]
MAVRVGHRIYMARADKGWTQQDLADQLALSRAAVSHFESGRREPDFTTLIQIADVTGVTMDYLFGRSERIENRRHAAPTE